MRKWRCSGIKVCSKIKPNIKNQFHQCVTENSWLQLEIDRTEAAVSRSDERTLKSTSAIHMKQREEPKPHLTSVAVSVRTES
jgi:regulator of replication initiation timing